MFTSHLAAAQLKRHCDANRQIHVDMQRARKVLDLQFSPDFIERMREIDRDPLEPNRLPPITAQSLMSQIANGSIDW